MRELSDDEKAQMQAKLERAKRDREEQTALLGKGQPHTRRSVRDDLTVAGQLRVVGQFLKDMLRHYPVGLALVPLVLVALGYQTTKFVLGILLVELSDISIVVGIAVIGPLAGVVLLRLYYRQWAPGWRGCVESKHMEKAVAWRRKWYQVTLKGVGTKALHSKRRAAIWARVDTGDYMVKDARSYEVRIVPPDEQGSSAS